MTTKFITVTLLALAGLLSGGCQSARVEQTVVSQHGGNDPDSQLAFWHGLAEAPMTSNDDAFHALLLAFADQDPANDYAGRVAAMQERAWLPKGFNQPAEAAVERGTVAVALAEILDIDGGVMMQLFGGPRYATREMQHHRVYPQSSPRQTFSGTEFVSIIARAEEHQQLAQNPQADAPAPADDQEGRAQ